MAGVQFHVGESTALLRDAEGLPYPPITDRRYSLLPPLFARASCFAPWFAGRGGSFE
jgi:hypothetical protein